jgi:hypothetical protein
MPEGPYSESEKRQIEEAARLVAEGRKNFSEAVDELTRVLDRSPRGVKLFLGRTVRRLNGTAAPRTRGAGGVRRRGRRNLEWLVNTARQKAGELEALKAQEERLGRRIETLEAELKELQGELLKAIGLSPERL